MRVIIIGGSAAGASCATRLRRLNEKAEIIILERTQEVSIANCGLPYYISGIIPSRDSILVSNAQKFKSWFNIDVRLSTEVISINKDEKFVTTNFNEKLNYDYLVLATGASSIVPNFEGLKDEKLFTLRTLADADKIKKYIKENNVKNAAVVGGGFIGTEIAENLIEMGLNTTLIEMNNQILASVDFEIAKIAQDEMIKNGVNLILSDGVQKFSENKIILNSNMEIDFDICIMAIGVKPSIDLAKNAGLKIDRGIIVDEYLKTSDEFIFAAGDNIETLDYVSEQNTLMPLAGPANRQGRIVADNIAGLNSVYKKTQGTSVVKVFNLTVANSGNNEKQLKQKKIPYWKTYIYGRSHAGYYPNSDMILFKLLFNDKGEILGIQGVGESLVEKRVDVIATIMRNKGTIQDMINSELCYAPPYSSAKDPVNVLAMTADNILKGLFKPAYFEDLKQAIVIDVRPSIVFNLGTIKNAINIPITEIRQRLNEIPKDKKVILFCNTGYTSYCASRILAENGFNNVYSLMGGYEFYKEMTNDPQKKEEILISADKNVKNLKTIRIDAIGLQCPGLIMKVAKTLDEAEFGDVFEIISTDKGFKSDIGAWCKSTGNLLIDLNEENKQVTATIQKGKNIENNATKTKNAQTIVVFSNDLDKALASFIIANGAKASGKEVTMFFTFWGLNILRKTNSKVKKSLIEKMFDLMMPKGAEKLTLSKMNMGGLGSIIMKWVMKKKNILTLSDLIKQAQDSGVKFIACNMSMDVMGIKEEELIDGVEIAAVAKYIAESNKSNANLFI